MSSDLHLLLDFFLLLALGVGEGSAFFFLLAGVESTEDSLCTCPNKITSDGSTRVGVTLAGESEAIFFKSHSFLDW